MGRYDFRPLRVHQATTQLLATNRITSAPAWYSVVGENPPAETLVRTQPIQHHHEEQIRTSKAKKPSKLFRPAKITYEEDKLRKSFFADHPWELARPRLVLENDARDAEKDDWSKIAQPHRRLSGENVVQRQLWLLNNVQNITPAKAYDQARKEFYDLRLQEEVEQRIAKEEALATGAYFGKSALQVGMELENEEWERWKEWAAKEHTLSEQRRAAMYTEVDDVESSDSVRDEDLDDSEYDPPAARL